MFPDDVLIFLDVQQELTFTIVSLTHSNVSELNGTDWQPDRDRRGSSEAMERADRGPKT